MRGLFDIRCSRAIFTDNEIEILERYGRQFEHLISGVRTPETGAQKRFVEVSRGKREPDTEYERVWWKYLKRVEWEKEPANKEAMGPRRRFPDDRDDWKKMRGAVWSGMRKRSKGLDE